MHDPVKYVISRSPQVFDLRTLARNLRGSNAAVIQALEDDPAIAVSWTNADGDRVTGSSIPTLEWANDPYLEDYPTYQWALGEGLQGAIGFQDQASDPSIQLPMRGDFDELAPEPDPTVTERDIAEQMAARFRRDLENALVTGEVEAGAGNEPPFTAEEQPAPFTEDQVLDVTPELTASIQIAASNMLAAMDSNGYAVPADAQWEGDPRVLLTYLSMTTLGGQVWREGVFEGHRVWVPIAINPELRRN